MKSLFFIICLCCTSIGSIYAQDNFDSWPLTGWTTQDGGINVSEETVIAVSGSSARVEVTTGSQSSTDWRQTVSVMSGVEYEICFDVYHPTGSDVEARIYAGDYYNYSDHNTVDQWQAICKTVTPTGSTLEIGLRFYDQSGFTNPEVLYIDNFTITSSLPVDLTSFQASNNNGLVTLDWQTASEVNNEGFHIERSVNGVDFDAIAFVDGHGDSQETINYSFVDDNAKPGLNYYRLKQVDYDGAFEYSDVISITTDILKATVSPSKTADLLTIFTPAETLSQIGLYNMSGNLMHSLELKNGSKTIDISDYPVGMYFVKILSEGQVQTEKIFKI